MKKIDSYRPINNLPCIEKIFESHILKHLQNYLTDNDIIDINHHGGRHSHSTTTALTDIFYKIGKNYDQDKIIAILATDLSAAFDTVDKKILLQKLDHYGIRNETLKLFINYLSGRQQFVRLDTHNSDILPSPDCSVIQGSKLSGIMYNIYTNEIPRLHRLLDDDIYEEMTFEKRVKYKNTDHHTVNFVDDSTSVITFTNPANIKIYIENYYKLISSFYNANRLCINADKTALLLINKPKHNIFLKHFQFKAGNYTLLPKNIIKILGVYIKKDFKMDSQVGRLCSNLHNRIFQIKKLTPFTNFKTRLNFIKSIVIGKIIYAIPLYMGVTETLMAKLHKVIMSAARAAIGSYCWKKSTKYILNKCNMLDIKDTIIYSTMTFIHNLNLKKLPKSLINLFYEKRSRDKIQKLRPLYMPKSKSLENNLIHKGTAIYNNLPVEFKVLQIEKFQDRLRQYLLQNDVWDSHD